MGRTRTIAWSKFSPKHRAYIRKAMRSSFCVSEGSVRAGKTIDACIVAAAYLETTPDVFHLASGSTIGNAKLNIGVCNGFGLENLFRGRCHWGKYRDNEALFIDTQTGQKIVIFAGGGKADSYKRILGNSYGLWIATEINEHYDADDSRTSFVKVAMARQAAAAAPMTLWDLNPSPPRHPIYTQYIDKYAQEKLPGYLYEHFTIYDNWSMTDAQREAFISRYDKSSVWYRHDILGQRVTAEGLIYPQFADQPERWAVSREELRKTRWDERRKCWKFNYITLGTDFGGNGSAHTFIASGIDWDYNLIALASERIPAKGVTVEELTARYLAFGQRIQAQYGSIYGSYCDSAEQTIIATFRQAAPWPVLNSLKNEIIDRIRATDMMMTTDRFRYVAEDCGTLRDALSECIWDPDHLGKWIRLDNGTTDIDTLDAFEYSWEPFIKLLIQEDKRQ